MYDDVPVVVPKAPSSKVIFSPNHSRGDLTVVVKEVVIVNCVHVEVEDRKAPYEYSIAAQLNEMHSGG